MTDTNIIFIIRLTMFTGNCEKLSTKIWPQSKLNASDECGFEQSELKLVVNEQKWFDATPLQNRHLYCMNVNREERARARHLFERVCVCV